MNRSIFILTALICLSEFVKGENTEEPLFLTKLIENGQVDLARNRSLVNHEELKNITSYAGYLTINDKYNSNSFFWFFPSHNKPETDPLLLWFQGGIGHSAAAAYFMFNGPFSMTDNQTLKFREHSFVTNHSVLYIDNPVGTGYSFTEDDAGYAKSQAEIGRDVVTFLKQFFTLFPDFKNIKFFVAGDSFGGRYSVSTVSAIKKCNDCAFNVTGVITGNPYLDPIQNIRADFYYYLGLVDERQLNEMKKIEQILIKWRKSPLYNFTEPTALTSLENSVDVFGSYKLVPIMTGLDNPMSLLEDTAHDKLIAYEYIENWMKKPETRKALHVGQRSYGLRSKFLWSKLKHDLFLGVTPQFEDLLETHKFLMYNGNLDILFPYASTVTLIRSLKWSAVEEFKNANRTLWYSDGIVAGYIRKAGNLYEVLVRNAGHIATYDQLHKICKLITRFTHSGDI